MARPEVWTTGIAWPGAVERAATRAEGAGFDGLAVVDSQNLAGDPWVGLTLAARETERLRLGTAVTNPVTRHPAVTAAAALPVEGAATGPRGLAPPPRHADRVLLALGADPDRVRWGIGTVRAAGGTSIGSFVNVVAHPDVDVARELARGGVATFARFSVMHGSVSGPVEPDERDTLAAGHDAYDLTRPTPV